jgi:hypothetical protein
LLLQEVNTRNSWRLRSVCLALSDSIDIWILRIALRVGFRRFRSAYQLGSSAPRFNIFQQAWKLLIGVVIRVIFVQPEYCYQDPVRQSTEAESGGSFSRSAPGLLRLIIGWNLIWVVKLPFDLIACS